MKFTTTIAIATATVSGFVNANANANAAVETSTTQFKMPWDYPDPISKYVTTDPSVHCYTPSTVSLDVWASYCSKVPMWMDRDHRQLNPGYENLCRQIITPGVPLGPPPHYCITTTISAPNATATSMSTNAKATS